MAMANPSEQEVSELEKRLSREGDGHSAFLLTPEWWQDRMLEWATSDPDFRVKLLRFVDVLPTLRSTRSVADHVRQYFRDGAPVPIEAATALASTAVFRPVLSQVVRQGVFAMAERFIAGSTPQEALPVLRKLEENGTAWTVDLLGEETLSDFEADMYLARYLELIEVLGEEGGGVGASSSVPAVNISIKLSALCPHLEPAAPEWVSAAAQPRLRKLMHAAIKWRAFINFDMEQFRHKDLVHRTFRDVVLDGEFRDYPHLGIVVQAYLRDALEDIQRLRRLSEERGTSFQVRLVKGAYWDEENIVSAQNGWPLPVFDAKEDTDANFDRCGAALFDARPALRSAIGSHNPRSVAQAIALARVHGLPNDEIEFQTLFGMAEDLRAAIRREGYRTRVYVPVGKVIPGMAYLVRRLLENTSNQAWFNVASAAPTPAAQNQGTAFAPADGVELTLSFDSFENAAPTAFFESENRERMIEALATARSNFGQSYPLLIAGRRISDRSRSDVIYPAEPDTVIGRVAQGTREDVDTAVAAATRAFPEWRDRSATERGDILRRAAEILERRRFEFATTMVFECAKPWHEADGDVIEAIDYLRYYAAQGETLATPKLMQPLAGEDNRYFHEGRGVAAIIAPWNFPLAIICGMATGALAGGNAAILKPAAQSPIIAFKLVEALHEAGVPSGVVQYLPGPGGEVGQALVEHADVDIIAFTGSSEVGLRIIESAARTRPGQGDVKRVIAEMGGKNAIIIDDDADLDQAVWATVVSAFGYAGQKCSACSRLIIVGSAYEETIERLKNAVASLVVGPPHLPETFVPPVIGGQAREKIMSYIESGKRSARLLVQADVSHLAASGGFYAPPTAFTEVPIDSDIACEEIFGPVLSVFRANDFAEALEVAMNSRFALTGGVFSRNPRHIDLARRNFRVGNLYINRKTTGAVAGRHPFGGLAMSGVGEKAGGPDYVRQFMDPRTLSENTMRRGFAPPSATMGPEHGA
jgi:RHH-type proline utilization regulon transcriptional repressor/proline dehydrogenase/delta 1-pyrroline-5-carboxylate dehydrogenase